MGEMSIYTRVGYSTSWLRVIKVDDRMSWPSVQDLRMYGSRWAAQPHDGACHWCVTGTSWFARVNSRMENDTLRGLDQQ